MTGELPVALALTLLRPRALAVFRPRALAMSFIVGNQLS
jgi:hypothetical protein